MLVYQRFKKVRIYVPDIHDARYDYYLDSIRVCLPLFNLKFYIVYGTSH